MKIFRVDNSWLVQERLHLGHRGVDSPFFDELDFITIYVDMPTFGDMFEEVNALLTEKAHLVYWALLTGKLVGSFSDSQLSRQRLQSFDKAKHVSFSNISLMSSIKIENCLT